MRFQNTIHSSMIRPLYLIPSVPVYTLAGRVALDNGETRFHVPIPRFNLGGLK